MARFCPLLALTNHCGSTLIEWLLFESQHPRWPRQVGGRIEAQDHWCYFTKTTKTILLLINISGNLLQILARSANYTPPPPPPPPPAYSSSGKSEPSILGICVHKSTSVLLSFLPNYWPVWMQLYTSRNIYSAWLKKSKLIFIKSCGLLAITIWALVSYHKYHFDILIWPFVDKAPLQWPLL